MNVLFSTVEKAAIAAQARKMIASDSHHESAVSFLREHGFDKLDSIKALVQARIPLAASKRTVHLSPTWQDVLSRDEALHDVVEHAVEELRGEEPPG